MYLNASFHVLHYLMVLKVAYDLLNIFQLTVTFRPTRVVVEYALGGDEDDERRDGIACAL